MLSLKAYSSHNGISSPRNGGEESRKAWGIDPLYALGRVACAHWDSGEFWSAAVLRICIGVALAPELPFHTGITTIISKYVDTHCSRLNRLDGGPSGLCDG